MNAELLTDFRRMGFSELDAHIAHDLADKFIKDTADQLQEMAEQLCASNAQRAVFLVLAMSYLALYSDDKLPALVAYAKYTGART